MTDPTGPDQTAAAEARGGGRRRAGAFDVRNFIGLLLGIYGVILLVTAVVSTSEADLAKADGINVNLWVGLGLVVAAVVFGGWARLRPITVPADPDSRPGAGQEV